MGWSMEDAGQCSTMPVSVFFHFLILLPQYMVILFYPSTIYPLIQLLP